MIIENVICGIVPNLLYEDCHQKQDHSAKALVAFNIKAVSSSFAASSRYYNSVAYSVRMNSCGIKGHSAICIGLYLQACAYMSRGWRKSQRVPFMASGFPRTIAKTQQRANQHFTAGNYITVVVMNDGYS